MFEESVAALRELNALGYGRPGSGLVLNLVTNPVGAFLPPDQRAAERDWKRELERRHGIVFDRLFTLTNMPISRFLEHLDEKGQTEAYLARLVQSFNPAAAAGVMCRTTLSVGWDGALYDCDFNQMLDLPLARRACRATSATSISARLGAPGHRARAALLRLHRGRGLKLRRGGRRDYIGSMSATLQPARQASAPGAGVPTIWLDGKWYDRETATVSVYDHGLLYGDGVFEGIRVYGGKIFRLAEHLERLYDSAHAIWLDGADAARGDGRGDRGGGAGARGSPRPTSATS